MNSKKIRLKDIAKMANVSVGTVDRVIHNRGEVAPDSYKRVAEILEKTGYKPNLLARTLGSHKTYHIAAIIPNPEQDEYWSLSAEGVKKASEEWSQYGIQVNEYYFDLYDSNSFTERAQSALESPPDAILIAPIFYQEATKFFRECADKNVPFVVFNNSVPDTTPLCFIGQNLYQSGRLGAELLHKNDNQPGTFAILHLYDDVHNSVHLYEKERGFKDYFNEEGGKDYIIKSVDLNYTHQPTIENELNDLLSDRDLKGILVTTSKGASTVSQLLEKRGKNGVRLVAYDLLKKNVRYLRAGIIDFLINQNSKRQGFTGVRQLANHLLFNKRIDATCFFPLEVISKQNLSSYLDSGVL